MSNWETIIGLEIHVQLNTKSKLFSSAANLFGSEPNTNLTPVCVAEPGTLPVINQSAVKKAIQFGLAIGANIAPFCKFDRKSYFYPDLPKGFQITQYDLPIVLGGSIEVMVEDQLRSFEINHAHLEDDTGILRHFSDFTAVDFNRSGAPLLEIVTEPCMRSGLEAAAVAKQIKAIMEYLDASDCNMDQGSLRIDVNCSVRKQGEQTLRQKVEIKNVNSFNYMQKAIEYEIRRQIAAYEQAGDDIEGVITSDTYRYDASTGTNILMRKKDSNADYRYFPEPDLPPLLITQEEIEEIKKDLPELPIQKTQRYAELGLGPYAIQVLVQDKKLAEYFEKALEHTSDAVLLSNWITVEFLGKLKDKSPLYETGIPAEAIASLVSKIASNEITGKIGKLIVDDLIADPSLSPQDRIDANPAYRPITDSSEIEKYIEEVLQENAQSIEDFHQGKDRAFGFLVGQVMKKSQGKADPRQTAEILRSKLSS